MADTVIRRATALDVVNIVKLLKKGYREQALPHQAVNEAKGVATMLPMIADTRSGLTLVADRSDRIVGVHANVVESEEWSDVPFISNAFFYVLPSERERNTAARLMEHVEKIADKFGLFIHLGTVGNERNEAKERLFRSRGYQYHGATFVREPHDEQTETAADNNVR